MGDLIDISNVLAAVADATNGARRNTALGRIREAEGVRHTPELDRILLIPRRVPLTPDEEAEQIDLLTNYLRTPGGTMRLRPVQAQALFEAHDNRGLFGPIRVSGGKTLISLLAPVVFEAKRPMLLVPAALVEKTRNEARKLAQHWRLPQFLQITSYQALGRVSGAELLEQYNPDLLICDEGHKLKNLRAAVTRRFARFMQGHPETVVIILTGTISKRSLRDFAHLLMWTLKLRTPLPRSYHELEAWALALDEKPNAIVPPLHPGAILKFATDEEGNPTQRARIAVRRRINDTPGVVTASGEGCEVSLRVQGHVVPLTGNAEQAFQTLRTKWTTPDGWPVSDGFAVWRHARELALGFYYTWWRQDKWVTEIQKTRRETISDIERRILNVCESTTERDTDLVKALGILQSPNPENGNGISRQDMASRWQSTKNSPQSMMVSVIFAEYERSRDLAKLWPLITIIEQGKSEGSFASPVTERLESWVTLLKNFPWLLNTLRQANKAARPPEDWLEARKKWSAFCRKVLKNNHRHLDSEMQVARACIDHPEWYGDEEYKAWIAIRDSFKPNTVAVPFDDSVIASCQQWMAKHGGGLVWCEHIDFARRLSAITGVPYFAGEGLDAEGRSIEDYNGKTAILSIEANREGRNLQRYSRNLVVSAMQQGDRWQQLLARTHRDGQEADEVLCDVIVTCIEHVEAMRIALSDAQYQEDITGDRQKLLMADVIMPETTNLRGAIWNR